MKSELMLQQILRSDPNCCVAQNPNRRLWIRQKLNQAKLRRQLCNLLDSIRAEKVSDLKIRIHIRPVKLFHRKRWSNVQFDDQTGIHIRSGSVFKTRTIELSTQIALVALCAKMLLLMQQEDYATVRHMYYTETDLLRGQVHCRDMIHDIAATLRVPRIFLHVYGSSWGSICGHFVWRTTEKATAADRDVLRSLPEAHTITSIKSDARFVLIVETDATAQALVKHQVQYKEKCIIIASRGFADANSRHMVSLLWNHLRIPIFALTDSDPSGMDIMLQYRFGSLSMAYESELTVCPAVRWLGIFPDQVSDLPQHRRKPFSQSDINAMKRLMRLPFIMSRPELLNCVKLMEKKQEKVELEAFAEDGIDVLAQFIHRAIQNEHYK